jgi:hypothetical protein
MTDLNDKHFGKIPHGWFDDNAFIKRLTRSERWILVCLASYIWRSMKIDPEYEIDKKLVRLYKDNWLLMTLMSERTLAEKCYLNRSTVCDAIDKFDDAGALIKIPGRKGKRLSNLYILGLYQPTKDKSGRVIRQQEFLFSDSPILRAGGRIPDDVKEFLRSNYSQRYEDLRLTNLPGFNRPLFPLIFRTDSPLIPRRDREPEINKGKAVSDLDQMKSEKPQGIGWISKDSWLENAGELAGPEPASKEV